MTHLGLLQLLLRIGGVATASAFLAMLLPVEWMAATHEWLELGSFPRAPIVDYLARSISALYGFHGVLLLLLARDPVRYHAIVAYAAWMAILFGLMMIAIDLHAGMPFPWTLCEGPVIVALGIAIGWLNRQVEGRPAQ